MSPITPSTPATKPTTPPAPINLTPKSLTPQNPLLTPHLFAGFTPAVGLTLLLAPPLLGSDNLAASLALAARQGRDLFDSHTGDPDRLVDTHPLAPGHYRESTAHLYHPVLFATHHDDRIESFFGRHPQVTLADLPTAPMAYRDPPPITIDPEELVINLEAELEDLERQTSKFQAALAARPKPEPDPDTSPIIRPFIRTIGAPLIILAPLLPSRYPGGQKLDNTLANFTKSLGHFARNAGITIIAILNTGPHPRAMVNALNSAMSLPGVASIISLGSDPEDPSNRILTPHIVRGVRGTPTILSAQLMEPRLDIRCPEVDPRDDLLAPDATARRARTHAIHWLKQHLAASRRPPHVPDIIKAAEVEGISRATLYRARHALRLQTHPNESEDTGFTWNFTKDTTETHTHRFIAQTFADYQATRATQQAAIAQQAAAAVAAQQAAPTTTQPTALTPPTSPPPATPPSHPSSQSQSQTEFATPPSTPVPLTISATTTPTTKSPPPSQSQTQSPSRSHSHSQPASQSQTKSPNRTLVAA